MKSTPSRILGSAIFLAALCLAHGAGDLGLFTDHGDVGTSSRPGTAAFDPVRGAYTIGSSGANMWFKADAMHYVWRRATGDLSIAADISFEGTSAQGHRKACLVIRQDLSPGSAYVDVAQHGDGLTSLQFRQERDGVTAEIQSNVPAPKRVRLDKIGDVVYLSVAGPDGVLRPSGASIRLRLGDPFYVGIAVSAHDDTAFETAVFSRVEVGDASAGAAVPQPGLKILTLPSGDRRVSDR
jgi:hypothetical protein